MRREICAAARLERSFGPLRLYRLPQASVRISQVFKKMELLSQAADTAASATVATEDAPVREWEIRMTSLEEVFVRLVEAHDAAAAMRVVGGIDEGDEGGAAVSAVAIGACHQSGGDEEQQ